MENQGKQKDVAEVASTFSIIAIIAFGIFIGGFKYAQFKINPEIEQAQKVGYVTGATDMASDSLKKVDIQFIYCNDDTILRTIEY